MWLGRQYFLQGDNYAAYLDQSGDDAWYPDEWFAMSEYLEPHQVDMLFALSRGKTVVEAAKIAEVSRATHYRWLKNHRTYKAEIARVYAEQEEDPVFDD